MDTNAWESRHCYSPRPITASISTPKMESTVQQLAMGRRMDGDRDSSFVSRDSCCAIIRLQKQKLLQFSH